MFQFYFQKYNFYYGLLDLVDLNFIKTLNIINNPKNMNSNKHEEIVGVKELRENLEEYISEVNKGKSFTIIKRSKPVFRITPLDEEAEEWENVVDFTKIKKGGVSSSDVREALSRL